MRLGWLLLCSAFAAVRGVRHSLQASEVVPVLEYNPQDERVRYPTDGVLSDHLKAFRFSDYSAETLRAAIVHQLSPGWSKLDVAATRKGGFRNVTRWLEAAQNMYGTISCVWDQTLNGGKHILENKRIFIAANFKDNEVVLPHLIVQIWHTMALLPEGSVFMSIYESSSKDQTGFWLGKFEELLKAMNIPYRIKSDGAIAYAGHDFHQRIELLSRVRNAALEPLWDGEELWHLDTEEDLKATSHRRRHPRAKRRADRLPPTHILFTNDVFACARDSIRLLYHEADVACGTDWWVNDGVLTFYDIWVARDISGAKLAWHPPYLEDPLSQRRIKQGLHVPVKSCWNGLVAIRAEPFLRGGLKFRTSRPEECFSSECKIICDDLIQLGFSNIIIDPGVRLTYLLQDATDAFKSDRVRELAISNWTSIRHSPIDNYDFRMNEKSECCPLSDDRSYVVWKNCAFQADKLVR